MFNAKEQEIIDYGLKNGKTKEQVTQAIANFRTGNQPVAETKPVSEPNYLQRLTGHYTKAAQDVSRAVGIDEVMGGQQSGLNKAITEANTARDKGDVLDATKGLGKTALEIARVPLRTVGAIADVAFSPITEAPLIKNAITEVGKGIVSIPGVKELVLNATELAKLYPEYAKDIENIVAIASLGLGGTAEKGIKEVSTKVAKEAVRLGEESLSKIAVKAGEATTKIADSGLGQITKDTLERIPRATQRAKEVIASSAEKATLIKNSTPEVGNAIKVDLDKGIIDTVSSVDKTTAKAFKDVIDIAETPAKGGIKKNPTIIAGDLAGKQYDILSKEKDSIGKQLGEATKSLSKTKKINLEDAFNQIDDTLENSGIKVRYVKKKPKLDFTGSKYTPAERTKIQELYKLAVEGGENLSPLQIREKDQLFSKLQREARMEGVGNLIIETPEGSKSMFSLFRDIYSAKLDTVSPEIKALNAKYSQLAKLTDDVESSIIKTPNFNATKSVDPAEFAKVNLRRIFGEAQSSPAFEAVADALDKTARSLGYKGAKPKTVAQFAEQIRTLYPDITPKTGFQGAIKTSVKGGIDKAIGKVLEAGAPNLADQQKALRELLNSLIK